MKREKVPGLKGRIINHRSGAAAAGGQPDLSAEEHALWRHVGQSIAPIRGKPRVRRGVPTPEADPNEAASGPPPRYPARSRANPPGPDQTWGTGEPAPGTPSARPAPHLAAFDPRKAKKIGTGRTAIDARLDLHGMRQDDALTELRHFLRDCHQRGLKTVLVITGKGREIDDPAMPFMETLDRSPRGVLRRNLPRWLDEPDLRAIVVSYAPAAQRHGGDGAVYIELRRRR